MEYLIIFLGVFILCILIVYSLGLYFFHFSIKRRSEYEPLEKYYVNLSKEKGWLYTNPLERVEIQSFDGLKLKAKYLKSEVEGNKLAIIVHGYTSKGEDMAGFAHLFHEKYQYHVLLPDLRGHGDSEGDYIGFGYHDHNDLLSWIDFSIQKFGDNIEIVLLGISMGGATVCMASGENLPQNVKCIISDCAYDSIENILAYQMKKTYKIPKFPLLPMTSYITDKKVHYKFSDGKAFESVEKSKTPILFIHGAKDEFVPTFMVYNLYEHARCEKKLLVIDEADHGMAYDTNPEAYNESLDQFLNQYMK